MILIPVFEVLLVIAIVAAKRNPDEEKCMKEVGISGEDVEMFEYDPMVPETRQEKCYWGCLYQAGGYINEEGTRFSRSGYLNAVLPFARNDEPRRKCFFKLADKCDGLANEDRCELGWMLMGCFGLTRSTYKQKRC